jgi:hypothetical protein
LSMNVFQKIPVTVLFAKQSAEKSEATSENQLILKGF